MPLDGAAATAAERARFLAARGGDEALAEEMLTAHLEWRARTLPLPAGSKTIGGGLPVFCKGLASKCKEGNRVLLVLGAMYDANAGTNEEYALALAALFDTQLDRNSDEKVTVLVDCRGGDGWPNPRPWAVVPWMRALAAILAPNFPERLHRFVIYPVPWIASSIWSAASAFLDERTAAKVCMLSGPAGRTEPVPEGINEFISEECLAACLSFRNASISGVPEPVEEAVPVVPAAPVTSSSLAAADSPVPTATAEATVAPPADKPLKQMEPIAPSDLGLAELELS